MPKIRTQRDRQLTDAEITAELASLPDESELSPDARARLRSVQSMLTRPQRTKRGFAHTLYWSGARTAVIGSTDPGVPRADLAELDAIGAAGDSVVGERARIIAALARGYSVADLRDVARCDLMSGTNSAYGLAERSRQCGWRTAVLGKQHVLMRLTPTQQRRAISEAVEGDKSARLVAALILNPAKTQAEVAAAHRASVSAVGKAISTYASETDENNNRRGSAVA